MINAYEQFMTLVYLQPLEGIFRRYTSWHVHKLHNGVKGFGCCDMLG